MQRWATKIIEESEHLPCKERLKRLGVGNLSYLGKRPLKGKMKENYTITHGVVKVDRENFFPLSQKIEV